MTHQFEQKLEKTLMEQLGRLAFFVLWYNARDCRRMLLWA